MLTAIRQIAARMGTPEGFRLSLPTLLQVLGLEIPVGVLQPRRGKPGRPASTTTENIHAKWVEMNKPEITAKVCDQIANDFFPDELKGIVRGSAQHRKVRERVRQAIQRGERRAAT